MDRTYWIRKRKSIEGQKRQKKEKAIVEQLRPFLKGNFALYWPVRHEVDVFTFLCEQYSFYLPKVLNETEMEFRLFTQCCQKGAFGIPEPTGPIVDPMKLDVIVVPMVGFHKTYRMGYGKGYYDRYLAKTNALKIGIAFDCQEMDTMDIKETDIPMDCIITETRRITDANSILRR